MKYQKIYCRAAITDFEESYKRGRTIEVKFRYCNATVGTTSDGEFTYLRSYNTIVALIDNYTGEAFDTLRVVYGYTATSAKHIAKFLNQYKHDKLFRFNEDSNGVYYIRRY